MGLIFQFPPFLAARSFTLDTVAASVDQATNAIFGNAEATDADTAVPAAADTATTSGENREGHRVCACCDVVWENVHVARAF